MTRGGLINKNASISIVTNSATGIFPLRDVLAERVDDNWTTNALSADVLLVAGGGCGARDFSGAGGAGGLVYQQNKVIGFGTHNISIGAGGVLNTTGGTNGFKTTFVSSTNGENTTAFGLTALGGGRGSEPSNSIIHGFDGGSGGGGLRGASGSTPGDGTQPNQSGDSGTYGFGNDGGSSGASNNDWGTGSGGGAGSVGKGNVTSGSGSSSSQPNASNRAGDGGDGKGIAIEGQRSAVSVSAVGNAQVSTAQWKFGGQSALFDGAGDSLSAGTSLGNFGTGDFTIEMWIYPESYYNGLFSKTTYTGSSSPPSVSAYITNSALLVGVNSGSATGSWNTCSGLPALNQWSHIAICRSGTSLRCFLNGSSVLDTTNSADVDNSDPLRIGYWRNSSETFDGYMDEIRFSSTARYTTAFTPPTKQFTNDLNTLLLLHMNGTNGTTTFTDDNVIYYAGGGGAGVSNRYGGNGAFGFGTHGGGNGSNGGRVGEDGQANTGGGGGSGGRGSGLYDSWDGGDGGSGLVVIRTLKTASATTGSPTTTTDGSYNIYKFTGSGSITF